MLGLAPSLLAVQCKFCCLFDSPLKILSSLLIYYSLFLPAVQMQRKAFFSSAAKKKNKNLPLCHHSTLSISRFLSLVMATSILSCSSCSAAHRAFALSHSHPRPHINGQAGCTVLKKKKGKKSHCYATCVVLHAAPVRWSPL